MASTYNNLVTIADSVWSKEVNGSPLHLFQLATGIDSGSLNSLLSVVYPSTTKQNLQTYSIGNNNNVGTFDATFNGPNGSPIRTILTGSGFSNLFGGGNTINVSSIDFVYPAGNFHFTITTTGTSVVANVNTGTLTGNFEAFTFSTPSLVVNATGLIAVTGSSGSLANISSYLKLDGQVTTLKLSDPVKGSSLLLNGNIHYFQDGLGLVTYEGQISSATMTGSIIAAGDSLSYTGNLSYTGGGVNKVGNLSGAVTAVSLKLGNALVEYSGVITITNGALSGQIADLRLTANGTSYVATGLNTDILAFFNPDGTVRDVNGNGVVEGKDLLLLFDHTAPVVHSVTDATSVLVTNDMITFTVTFDEPIAGAGIGNFSAMNGVVSSVAKISNTAFAVKVIPTAGVSNGIVYLTLAGAGLTDVAGNAVANADLSSLDSQGIHTVIPGAPVSLSDSAINQLGIVKSASQIITGTAPAGLAVNIYDTDGTTLLGTGTSDAISGAFSISVNGLKEGVHTLQATATDAVGNRSIFSAGLQFVVDIQAPVVNMFTPSVAAKGVAVSSDIVLAFNEEILPGTGYIDLCTDNGTVVERFSAATGTYYSISGKLLTLNPTQPLDYGTHYFLAFTDGAVLDRAGNSFISTIPFNFTTNYLPGGTVAITGLAIQGEKLTAKNTLSDVDGLGIINYKWQADGVDISGAATESYLLTKDDVGKKISVVASYVDGHGTIEKQGSLLTEPVSRLNNGVVQDGYLAHALVWVDGNNDNILDWQDSPNGNGAWDSGEGEAWTITDGTGQFSALVGNGTIRMRDNAIVNGGNATTIDISTGKLFTGSFSAPAGSAVVNPLTTLIVAAGGDAAAEILVKNALGLQAVTDLTKYDPLAEASKGGTSTPEALATAIQVQSAATQIANIMDIAAGAAKGAGSASTNGIAASVASSLITSAGGGTLDLTASGVISTAISSAATNSGATSTGLANLNNTIGAIITATSLVNSNIAAESTAAIADAAQPGGSVNAGVRLTNITKAQIVAQQTIASDANTAVATNSISAVTTSAATLNSELTVAAAGVQKIFVNHLPTGALTISGAAKLGEQLTVINTLADAEGISGAVSFQWQSNGVDITGATGVNYILSPAEIGKLITVRGMYIDGAGNQESPVSAATVAVAKAPANLSALIVNLATGSDTGRSNSDNLTNSTKPVVRVDLSGKFLAAGDVVQIMDSNHGNMQVGSYLVTDADSAGGLTIKEITLDTALSEDPHDLRVQLTDRDGNSGQASLTPLQVVIDTTPPVTTISGIALGVDSGDPSDFNTNHAVQTISATLSSGLLAEERLYGSVDDGSTWNEITGSVDGVSVNWNTELLPGIHTIKFEVRDSAGNAAPVVSQSVTLDMIPPSTTAAGTLDITSGRVTGRLSAALQTGESLQGSVDNGTTWQNLTVNGTSFIWDVPGVATKVMLEVRDIADNRTITTITAHSAPSAFSPISLVPGTTLNEPILTLDLPQGISFVESDNTSEGVSWSQQLNAAADFLNANNSAIQGGITDYINSIVSTDHVTVRTISFSGAATQPGEKLAVKGDTDPAHKDVLVIELPAGSQLDLDNVEFAVIAGENITIRGGAGNNIVYAGNGHQDIVLGPGDDELHGGPGDDNIGSLGGNDTLYGDGGNDTISGGADNDELHGGAGDDVLDGGDGVDTAVFSGNYSDFAVTFNAITKEYTVADKRAGHEGTDLVTNVEFFKFDDMTKPYRDFADAFYVPAHSGSVDTVVCVGIIGALAWVLL